MKFEITKSQFRTLMADEFSDTASDLLFDYYTSDGRSSAFRVSDIQAVWFEYTALDFLYKNAPDEDLPPSGLRNLDNMSLSEIELAVERSCDRTREYIIDVESDVILESR